MKDQTFYNAIALAGAIIVLASFAAGVLGTRVGATTTPPNSGPAAPNGGHVGIVLRAYLSGFIGVGGSIDGLRDPMLYVLWGDRVSITLVDGQPMEHNVHVDGYGVQTLTLTAVNESASVSFWANTEGRFAYYCTIPGHRAAGMAGTLVVGNTTGEPIGPELPRTTPSITLPPDAVPAPITRNFSATVNVDLAATEETAEVEAGVSYHYDTFNGSVPGPFIRVRVGDTVSVHLYNSPSSTTNHSVDFGDAFGPQGGAAVPVRPGGWSNFTFLAETPGLFLYEGGPPAAPAQVASGMFGLILVQPAGGLATVAHEFYLVENSMFTHWPIHTLGNQLYNASALLADTPSYVVFNGAYDSVTGDDSLSVPVNDTVRVYFANAGPNDFAAFHMVGGWFDRAYLNGDLTNPAQTGTNTVPVPPGGTAVIELTARYPGNYTLEDARIGMATLRGAEATLAIAGPANASVFHQATAAGIGLRPGSGTLGSLPGWMALPAAAAGTPLPRA